MMDNYFMETHHHEWILTNLKGGYALGTGNLINQRKYHGLLIAGSNSIQRTHLVAGIEEKVEWRGESFHLDSNNYSNCIYPEGFLYLVKPWLRPYPIFLYSSLPHQNDILIRKEILMDDKTNTVLLKYTNLGHHKLHMEFHPKYTMLNHHELNNPGSIDFEPFEVKIESSEKGTEFYSKHSSRNLEVYGYCLHGNVKENRYTYYNVFFPWDAMKGYSGVGDQVSLFEINFDLAVGESNYILFSVDPIKSLSKTIDSIQKKYSNLPKPSDFPENPDKEDTLLSTLDLNDSNLFGQNDYDMQLQSMISTFLINDNVVAGYPWYNTRALDSIYVLKAISNSIEFKKTADKILKKYMRLLDKDLLYHYPEQELNNENYVALDATLLLLMHLGQIATSENNTAYINKAVKLIEKSIVRIIKNKTYPFFIREDKLIELNQEYSHATWMNTRIDGKPATPRDGAPVEINAYWYQSVKLYLALVKQHQLKQSKDIPMELETQIKHSFNKYLTDNFIADRLKGDEPVAEIRPNAILAASVTDDLFTKEQLANLFDVVSKHLYTNYGIRTLSPDHSNFKKKYYGLQRERDFAYHNGSVWAWLLEPYCQLYLKIYQKSLSSKELIFKISEFTERFRHGIFKGHISSVAEIWDGEAPHFPKGAPAFAMSVAALYSIENIIHSLKEK